MKINTYILLVIPIVITNLHATPILQYPNALNRQKLLEVSNHETIQNEKKKTLFIPIKQKNKDTLMHTLNAHYPNSLITYHELTHQLVLTINEHEEKDVITFINSINKTSSIIELSISLYEISFHNDQEKNLLTPPIQNGIKINYSADTIIQAITTDSLDTLKIMESNGQASLLANPFLRLNNNATGTLTIGEKIPYITTTTTTTTQTTSLQHLNSGINIEITPKQLNHTTINCRINIKLSLVKLWKIINENEYPVLSNRNIESELLLTNDTPLLIAGFTDNFKKENTYSMPFINKIPLLKHLFKQKTKQTHQTAICIIITPHLNPQ